MGKNTRNIIITGAVIVTLTVVTIVVYNKLKVVPNTPEGFNGVVQKAKKAHPEIYAWWESLPTEKQITIESNMSVEILTFLEKELTKNNLSEEAKRLLGKAGYVG